MAVGYLSLISLVWLLVGIIFLSMPMLCVAGIFAFLALFASVIELLAGP